MAKSRTKPKRNRTGYRPFCEKGLCQRNLWLAPASWRKNNSSRRRRESEFVWKNEGKSVGRASRVPPFGFEKAVKFCFGAQGGNRTHTTLWSRNFKSRAATNYATWANFNILIFKIQNWRPGAELNRRIRVLQTLALPLGDQAIIISYFSRSSSSIL